MRGALALLLCACGRLGFESVGPDGSQGGDGDADGDGGGSDAAFDACTPSVGVPVRVDELAGLGARGPTLSGDGAVIVFSADGAGGTDLWSATRNPDGTFGGAAPIQELNTPGADSDPTISADGLELFFDHGACIEVARRPSVTASWGAPVPIAATCAEGGVGAVIAGNGLALYYTVGPADPQLAVVRRPDRDGAFAARTLVQVEGASSAGYPYVSPDELTLYFEAKVGASNVDLFRATRREPTARFGPPVALGLLNSSRVDEDAHIVGDRLYFSSDRGGGFDLYVAPLTCE